MAISDLQLRAYHTADAPPIRPVQPLAHHPQSVVALLAIKGKVFDSRGNPCAPLGNGSRCSTPAREEVLGLKAQEPEKDGHHLFPSTDDSLPTTSCMQTQVSSRSLHFINTSYTQAPKLGLALFPPAHSSSRHMVHPSGGSSPKSQCYHQKGSFFGCHLSHLKQQD